MEHQNIILVGFMGSGKTVVGKLLAKKLKMTYIDTDQMIEQEQGKSINDIFADSGEGGFRDMETNILDDLQGTKKHVISTGGGIILRPENAEKLKALGLVVLLSADPNTLYSRLKDLNDRPLLRVPDPKARIEEMLKARQPHYKKAAEMEVDTSGLTPEEVCDRIIEYDGKGK